MEILGAVGSSIAIVQALQGVRKGVDLIRAIPDIQNDFDCLISEIELLEAMAQEVQRLPPESLRQDLITKASGLLSQVNNELAEVLKACARGTNDTDKKTWRTKKRRWLFESGKIKNLEQNVRVSAHPRFRAEVQMFMRPGGAQPTNQAAIAGPRVEELPNDEASIESEDDYSTGNTVAAPSSGQESTAPMDLVHTTLMGSGSLVRLQTSMVTHYSACPQPCRCRCHFSESSYQMPTWLRPLLGSWHIRLIDLPGFRRNECTEPECRRSDPAWIKLEYQVPRWFYDGPARFNASYSSLTGLGCSLRPARTISSTASIWVAVEKPYEVAKRAISEESFYPNDCDNGGLSIMQVYYGANSILQSMDIGDHETYLLHRVLSFVKDKPESTSTEIHDAIRQGAGLQEAIQNQPWAIDMLDCTGFAPLHLAAELDQAGDMKQLIDAGANVDQKDSGGRTPLMMAAHNRSVDSAKVLLKANCSPSLTDSNGETALHFAARENSPELVGYLIGVGASPAARNGFGDTPLHELARYGKAGDGNTQRVFDLLVLAKADVEATDILGQTPLLTAILYDNLPAAQCLVEGGCSLLAVDRFSQNILHFAALDSGLEMLHFLRDLIISDINPYLVDSNGNIPWDLLVYASLAPEWKLGSVRRPTRAEQEAFVQLYQSIRDGNLQHDIHHLERVSHALLERDAIAASKSLAPLTNKEEEWKRDLVLARHRALNDTIQNAEWEQAEGDVREWLAELRDELNTPARETLSHWWFVCDQEWEKEYDHDDESVDEDGSLNLDGSSFDGSDDEHFSEARSRQPSEIGDDDWEERNSVAGTDDGDDGDEGEPGLEKMED
ncbi:hypothetical protein FZEAL_2286 [Fusarium zealandicum]|uniref:NACHT-NTPase and P-loop NTPases N-terminal domain-containing protein n=1 Tax=Fusarium zealandicum TaxID=1053134 RepID=A0A8H4XMX4_9HYPO|nr:hypothetical protein FZEAL_2286 [Fusarium zealandicum]